MNPNSAELRGGQQQQFTKTQSGAVQWSVSPAGFGVVSPSGLYTSPNQTGSAQVIATGGSVESATVTVTGIFPVQYSYGSGGNLTKEVTVTLLADGGRHARRRGRQYATFSLQGSDATLAEFEQLRNFHGWHFPDLLFTLVDYSQPTEQEVQVFFDGPLDWRIQSFDSISWSVPCRTQPGTVILASDGAFVFDQLGNFVTT